MQKSEQINELAAALAKAQAAIQPAKMDATNPFLKNRYASLNSVMEAIKPALAKHGLSIVQLPTSENGEIGLETVILHESGQWVSNSFYMPVGEEKGKSMGQVIGSTISYMRRYAVSSALGVVADEDTDGNQPVAKPMPNPRQTAKPAANDDLLLKKRKEFHAVGVEVYGDAWDDKRGELTQHVTNGKSKSSNDLTYSQLDTLIQGMRSKTAQQASLVGNGVVAYE